MGSTGAEKGHYTFQWDNSEAPSGVYIFQAVAVAGFGSRTQGMPVSIAFNYYNGAPPPPTGLHVTSVGTGVVNLGWTAPSTGYVDHYEVWRSTTAWRSPSSPTRRPSLTRMSTSPTAPPTTTR